jgi:hypothetical protein
VTLEGFVDPVDGSRKTVLDRGNTAGGTAVFQFTGADDVTIRGFGITGAETGVTINDVDSDRVTVADNEIFANTIGIRQNWYATGDTLTIANNDVWGNRSEGISVWFGGAAATQPVVVGNRVYANSSGIGVGGAVLVTGNTVWRNSQTGISMWHDGPVARDNVVFDNGTLCLAGFASWLGCFGLGLGHGSDN